MAPARSFRYNNKLIIFLSIEDANDFIKLKGLSNQCAPKVCAYSVQHNFININEFAVGKFVWVMEECAKRFAVKCPSFGFSKENIEKLPLTDLTPTKFYEDAEIIKEAYDKLADKLMSSLEQEGFKITNRFRPLHKDLLFDESELVCENTWKSNDGILAGTVTFSSFLTFASRTKKTTISVKSSSHLGTCVLNIKPIGGIPFNDLTAEFIAEGIGSLYQDNDIAAVRYVDSDTYHEIKPDGSLTLEFSLYLWDSDYRPMSIGSSTRIDVALIKVSKKVVDTYLKMWDELSNFIFPNIYSVIYNEDILEYEEII